MLPSQWMVMVDNENTILEMGKQGIKIAKIIEASIKKN